MRKLILASLALAMAFTSCETKVKTNEESASTDQSERNLASARAVANAFKTGNTASIDSVVAEDFLDHTDQGDKVGRDSLKAMITLMHKSANDMKMETIRDVADDEYVFQWMRYTGTSDGSMGPKGPYDMKVIEVSKHNDGKIVEHWAYVNAAEMMKMMAPPAKPALSNTGNMKK